MGALVAAALIMAAAGGPLAAAAEPAAGLDRVLTQAMDRNPGLAALKAKVALAEAELRSARFETARQVIACWNEIKLQEQLVAANRKLLKEAEQGGVGDKESIRNAVISDEAKLARARSELEFLIGQGPPVAAAALASRSVPMNSGRAAPPLQVPRGPMVEKVRRALREPGAMQFVDTPLWGCAVDLMTFHHIEIQLDEKALSDSLGPLDDLKLNFTATDVPLAAALQAIDDKFRDLKFVVRDYGILITTPEQAESLGYMPVVEFARLAAGAEPAAAGKVSEPEKPKGPAPKPRQAPPAGQPR